MALIKDSFLSSPPSLHSRFVLQLSVWLEIVMCFSAASFILFTLRSWPKGRSNIQGAFKYLENNKEVEPKDSEPDAGEKSEEWGRGGYRDALASKNG